MRNFIGNDVRPVEVVCWSDTQVHPIQADDSAVGPVRFASGATAQFETGWLFPGGDEVAALGYTDLKRLNLEAWESISVIRCLWDLASLFMNLRSDVQKLSF